MRRPIFAARQKFRLEKSTLNGWCRFAAQKPRWRLSRLRRQEGAWQVSVRSPRFADFHAWKIDQATREYPKDGMERSSGLAWSRWREKHLFVRVSYRGTIVRKNLRWALILLPSLHAGVWAEEPSFGRRPPVLLALMLQDDGKPTLPEIEVRPPETTESDATSTPIEQPSQSIPGRLPPVQSDTSESTLFESPRLGSIMDRDDLDRRQALTVSRAFQNEVGVMLEQTGKGQLPPQTIGGARFLTNQQASIHGTHPTWVTSVLCQTVHPAMQRLTYESVAHLGTKTNTTFRCHWKTSLASTIEYSAVASTVLVSMRSLATNTRCRRSI